MNQAVNKLILELLSYPLFSIFVVIGIIGLTYLIIKNVKSVITKNTINREIINDTSKDMICPKCGGVLVERAGKYGEFLGCNNYPKCNFTKS